jgi:hypothetical protein
MNEELMGDYKFVIRIFSGFPDGSTKKEAHDEPPFQ